MHCFVGVTLLLGVNIEVLKAQGSHSGFLYTCCLQKQDSQLVLQYYACLQAAMLPVMLNTMWGIGVGSPSVYVLLYWLMNKVALTYDRAKQSKAEIPSG